MDLDPLSLKLFAAVIEHGSIAGAAERHHIAAAAVSKRMSELEALLRTALLKRTNKGVEATPAGFALLGHAHRLLRDMDEIFVEMRDWADGVRGQVRVCANISAITQFLPREIAQFLRRYPEKCRIIHYGLNLDRFAATPEIEAQAAAWKARYDHRPLLLFVGRLRHYKGVNVLIEAMQQLPQATALIVGIGPMAEEWQQQAQAAGLNDRVHFLGEQPDAAVLPLYHAADIFVLPSTNRAETFGIVQLEAMACGCPVISTELGTGTSYVNQNEVTGLVVPSNDAPALAAAVRRLLADPSLRARMGAAGLQRAHTEFSIGTMLDRTLDFYHEALA